MPLWSSAAAEAATSGKATTQWQATGVSIDTRTLAPGDLFVALKDIRDGHDFVAQALGNGAAAALVSRIPEGVADTAPLLIVDDVLEALEALGRAARARTKAQVIGVTGSVGKTSTKEMLRTMLSAQGKTHAAEKSYNNHWGVPLTLARMPADSVYAVIEIGMNHPGEIAPLARMAQLDVAMITTVAPAHLEAFESIEGIAREKSDIFKGLMETGGVAVINADLDSTALLLDAAPFGCERFGKSEGAEWQLTEMIETERATTCAASYRGEKLLFKINAPGAHFALNGLGALAACVAAGADLGQSVVALGQWQPPQGRGARQFISLDVANETVGIDLIDDAYNANPASIGAALQVLAQISPPGKRGRRVAILGDMKELGQTEADLHRAIAQSPATEQLDQIHCVGPLMKHLHAALPADRQGLWAETSAELAAQPSALAQAGDVVMAKGSLSMKMALIVDAIRNMGHITPLNDKGPH
ncbi:MAG: UDP-N-acetylmuramoyl-tripeptide--D-alanyl-D-alanine ligase [Pseudomonadota bacterium]